MSAIRRILVIVLPSFLVIGTGFACDSSLPVPTHTDAPTATPRNSPTPNPVQSPEPIKATEVDIDALPWVQDGLSGIFELESLKLLEEMMQHSPEVAYALLEVERSWLPARSGAELSTLRQLVSICKVAVNVALRLVDMPFLEGVEWVDLKAVEYLERMARSGPGSVEEMLSHRMLDVGITDEQAVLVSLLYLEAVNPEAAGRIEAMPWVQDGIAYFPPEDTPPAFLNPTVSEQSAVLELVDAALGVHSTFWALTQKSWLQGWDDPVAVSMMSDIIRMAYVNETTSLGMLEMPFLDTFENSDAATVRSLLALAELDPAGPDSLFSDPAFVHGITDKNMSGFLEEVYRKLREASAGDAEFAQPRDQGAGIASWLLDPPDSWHNDASRTIGDLWLQSPEIGRAISGAPWITDGIIEEEVYKLRQVQEIVNSHPELTQRLSAYWSEFGISPRLVWHLHRIASADVELTRRILDLAWVADGLTVSESQVLSELTGPTPVDEKLIGLLLGIHWFTDGITGIELEGVDSLTGIWRSDEQLGDTVFELPWVKDGITNAERVGLQGLNIVAYGDVPLAWQILESADRLLSIPGDLAWYSLASLGQLGEFSEDLMSIVEQAWFADGLDLEEAAFITTFVPLVYDNPALFASLLQSHHALSRTASLPISGEIRLWAFSNAPVPEEDGFLSVVEDAARTAEELVGVPFPTTDIIFLVVVPGDGIHATEVGLHLDTHIRISRSGTGGFGDSSDLLRHEVAHYYFTLEFGPFWLREGAADFAVAYGGDRRGTQSLGERREALMRSNASCVSAGIENISHLNRLYPNIHDSPSCAYPMGEYFLSQIFDLFGQDAFSSALRELHLLSLSRDTGSSLFPTNEEIYSVFVKNAPLGLEQEFQDLYERLHGGQN